MTVVSSPDDPQGTAARVADTGADALLARLKARGVRRIFGVPGGDCSLDVIDAAERAGIAFVLTRSETAAALMAAATAEVGGGLGVVLTTRGPGIANVVNGIAYAALDRVPLLLIGDGYEAEQAFVSHQRLDQEAMLAPLVKASLRLDSAAAFESLDALLDRTDGPPPGPVYLELVGSALRERIPAERIPAPPPRPAAPAAAGIEGDMAAAEALLAASRRPLVIAGLQACAPAAAEGLNRLLAAWRCPLLYSYKAKGVVPDNGPHAVGPFIDGDAERGLIESADAVVFFGADPVEFPPQRWRYDKPVLDLRAHALEREYLAPQARLTGGLGDLAARLAGAVRPGGWQDSEIAAAREEIRSRAHRGSGRPIAPQDLVDAAIAAAPEGTRATVDAGAHMLPVMSLWIARKPRDVLISRGLSTMAFALPAAIGAALAEPDRPTVAFTGDGGLMMCAGELATAAQNRCRLVVLVFNDSSIALIDVKRQRRQLPRIGMSYSETDFAAVARGFGCRGYRVERPDDLPGVLAEAFAGEGPAVVDVRVDAGAYHEQIRALRG